MPKNSDGAALQKHTLMLFEGDFAKLAELYPVPGPSIVLRKILRDFLEKHEAIREIPEDITIE